MITLDYTEIFKELMFSKTTNDLFDLLDEYHPLSYNYDDIKKSILGEYLFEIAELIDEINRDVFNNSYTFSFEIYVNNRTINEFIYCNNNKTKEIINSVSIYFIERNGFTRRVSITYTENNLKKLTKSNVLEWMTLTIFNEIPISNTINDCITYNIW